MSKGHDGAEKAEKTKETHTGDAKKAEAKGADQHKTEHKKAEAPPSKAKGHNPMPGGCFCWGCKAQASQFNFCAEHYDHFKFGLIKKTGEPVPDYEKKFGHYMAHKAKRGATRAA